MFWGLVLLEDCLVLRIQGGYTKALGLYYFLVYV